MTRPPFTFLNAGLGQWQTTTLSYSFQNIVTTNYLLDPWSNVLTPTDPSLVPFIAQFVRIFTEFSSTISVNFTQAPFTGSLSPSNIDIGFGDNITQNYFGQ